MLVNLSYVNPPRNYFSLPSPFQFYLHESARKKAISAGGIFSRLASPSSCSMYFISLERWRHRKRIILRFLKWRELLDEISCGVRYRHPDTPRLGVSIETSHSDIANDVERTRIARNTCRWIATCACGHNAINISFPTAISFGFQCKCKTAA